jgi:branched-chain amino acid transport system substrate-binding protein
VSHPRRSIPLVALALASALVVAGCSSSAKGGSSAGTSKEVVIGAALPLTGSAASYGAIMKDGMELAINEINSAGGINGAQVKAEYVDSQGNPGLSVGLTRQLVANKVVAVTTCFPAVALAQEPLTAKAQVPLLGPCLNENAQLNLSGFYNLTATTDQEREAMLQYMYDKKGIKNVAILSETATSAASNNLMVSKWKSLSGSNANLITIDTGATDSTPQITKLLQSHPDAIYVLVNGSLGDTVAKNLAAAGVRVPIYGNIASTGYLKSIQANKLNWTYTTGVSQYTDAFTAAFKKAHPARQPTLWDGSFYSAVYVVKQGLEAAAKNGGSLDAKSLYKTMESQKTYTGCCGPITFTSSNGVEGSFDVFNSKDGAAPQKVATVPAS